MANYDNIQKLMALLEGKGTTEETSEETNSPDDPVLFKAYAALKLAKSYFDQLLTSPEDGWDKSHPHLPRAAVMKTAELLTKAETQATNEVRKDRVSSFQSKSKRVIAKLDKLMAKLTEDVEDLLEATTGYDGKGDGETGEQLIQALTDYWFLTLKRAFEAHKYGFEKVDGGTWKPTADEFVDQFMLMEHPIPYPGYTGKLSFKDRDTRNYIVLDVAAKEISTVSNKSKTSNKYGPM